MKPLSWLVVIAATEKSCDLYILPALTIGRLKPIRCRVVEISTKFVATLFNSGFVTCEEVPTGLKRVLCELEYVGKLTSPYMQQTGIRPNGVELALKIHLIKLQNFDGHAEPLLCFGCNFQ